MATYSQVRMSSDTINLGAKELKARSPPPMTPIADPLRTTRLGMTLGLDTGRAI